MSAYGERALRLECALLASTPEGSRNHQLNVSALKIFSLVEGGELDEQDAISGLTVAAKSCGLGQQETISTLKSARRAAQPRTAPPLPGRSSPRALAPVSAPDRKNGKKVQEGLLCAQDVDPRAVRWLWEGHIPRGKITLLAGLPGVGKTTIALTVGALVTRGTSIPLSSGDPVQGGICIVSTEDDADDTIVPRLIAAGADLSRCWIWPDSVAVPSLPDEADLLAEQLEAHDCRLLVIDPVSVILSGTVDAHKDADVRRCLAALRKIARRLDCAILGIGHLNKSAHGGALHRIGGSGAWVAAARSVLLVSADPDGDIDAMVVAAAKVSSARRPPTIRMRRVDHGDVYIVEWVGECDMDADDLVSQTSRGPAPEARSEAEAWLAEFLAPGPQWASDGYTEAEAAGISKRTLQRARTRLRVKATKEDGRWVWAL